MSEKLGSKIKGLREASNLTHSDLAEAAGIDAAQIVLIENDEVSPAISTLEIEGKQYFLTPAADMAEWLEDLEDVVDSIEAMRDAADAISWEKWKFQKKSLEINARPDITVQMQSKGRKRPNPENG